MEGLSLQGIGELFGLQSALKHSGSLLSLGLLIIAAKLTEGVFRRLRLKSIVAYATAGILLGPVLRLSGAWWIEPSLHLELLLTLGIYLFFFLIGIDEVDIASFMSSIRGRYFLAAILSVIFSLGDLDAGHHRSRFRFRTPSEFHGGAGRGRSAVDDQPGHSDQSAR